MVSSLTRNLQKLFGKLHDLFALLYKLFVRLCMAEQTSAASVTTPEQRYTSIKAMLETYGKLYDIPASVISAYMPGLHGARTKYLYQILLAVARLKEPSKAKIIKTLCAGNKSALQAIDHLERHGYIQGVGKPRLIKPFRKYKIDTGYVITSKGLEVLDQIIFSS